MPDESSRTIEQVETELMIVYRREQLVLNRLSEMEQQNADTLVRNEIAVQRHQEQEKKIQHLIEENEELQKENQALKHEKTKSKKEA